MPPSRATGYTHEADIAYGPDPRQKLDLYRPDKPRADGKTVIFFYGGAWETGSKGDYLFVAQALVAGGYTVVIPDYRLYPAVRFPAFVDDGARAARWTADRVGSDKVFVMGHSAGAHIALLLAANTPYLATAGVDRMKLGGVIGLSGPYDFLPLKSAKLIEIFGGPNKPDIEAITFARAPLPPALADPWHGRHDGLSAQQRKPGRGVACGGGARRAEALSRCRPRRRGRRHVRPAERPGADTYRRAGLAQRALSRHLHKIAGMPTDCPARA